MFSSTSLDAALLPKAAIDMAVELWGPAGLLSCPVSVLSPKRSYKAPPMFIGFTCNFLPFLCYMANTCFHSVLATVTIFESP